MDTVKILAVFIGGGFGSVLRFIITLFITKLLPSPFPYGTLAANLIGCLTIGILMALFTNKIDHPELKLFFTTGMMGGLTTFSTFSFESNILLRNHDYIGGLVNISTSLLGCLLLTFLGYRISLYFLGQ